MAPPDPKSFWDAGARSNPARYMTATMNDLDGRFWASGEADVAHVVSALGLRLSPDVEVLEIGAGAGRLSSALASRAGRIIAADVSPNLLALAADRIHDDERLSTLELPGDGTIPLPDNAVDLVFSQSTFKHIPSREVQLRYLDEAIRVVRPWGSVVLQFDTRVGPAARLRRVAAAARNVTRGIHALSPFWIGHSIPLSDLLAIRPKVGLLSVLNIDDVSTWVVADVYSKAAQA